MRLVVGAIALVWSAGPAMGQLVTPMDEDAGVQASDDSSSDGTRLADRDVSPQAASELINEQIDRIGEFRVSDAIEWIREHVRPVTWGTAGVVVFVLFAGGVIRPGSFRRVGVRDVKAFPSPIWLAMGVSILLAQHLAVDAFERLPLLTEAEGGSAPDASGDTGEPGAAIAEGAEEARPAGSGDADPVRRRAIVMSMGYCATVVVGLMLVYLMRKSKGGADSGLRVSSFDMIRGIGCMIVALPVILAAGMAIDELHQAMTGAPGPRIAHKTLAEIVDARHSAWSWLVIGAIVIFVPIVEELIFRVGLQSALLRFTRSSWVAILLTSIAFTGAHIWMLPDAAWHAYGQLFVLSLAIGIVFERGKRLGAPIAMHMAFNALTVCVAMSIADGPQDERGVDVGPDETPASELAAPEATSSRAIRGPAPTSGAGGS